MVEWLRSLAGEFQYIAAASVLVIGLVAGYLVGRINARLLRTAGVPEAVEGTSLERTARNFGTDTVSLIARASSWVIYVISALYALEVAHLVQTGVVIARAGDLLPSYILALLIVLVGLLLGDKAEVLVGEYLRGVKLPEVGVVGTVVRYTIVFVSLLFGLAQIGIAVGVLLILLGGYLLAVILFSALAFRHLLTSAAAGLYLLLNQPYGIGDQVEIDDRRGVVQEVSLFVTRIEEDGREYIVPNHLVFRDGAIRIRD
ncbi:MAG: mechanosensitive ion channel domain-containing protein [Halodesulfurarchaeum sp.]